jgi:hypothetical protein
MIVIKKSQKFPGLKNRVIDFLRGHKFRCGRSGFAEYFFEGIEPCTEMMHMPLSCFLLS